jgi:hypothetical protein
MRQKHRDPGEPEIASLRRSIQVMMSRTLGSRIEDCRHSPRFMMSAVSKNQPLKVGIKEFKTSHFLEQKTAPKLISAAPGQLNTLL